MFWFNETEESTKERIMSTVNQSLGGTATEDNFWLAEVKKYKANPQKRYEAALKGFPLPAAFREAALGLRAIIREKAKNNQSFEKELKELYKIAVWQSFSMSYSVKAQTTGYSILERIPGSVIANLDYNYQDMGYEELELINKTDAKRLVELWGKPNSHKTLLEVYPNLWKKYEDEYIHIISTQGYAGLYEIKTEDISNKEESNAEISSEEKDSKPSIFKNILKKIF